MKRIFLFIAAAVVAAGFGSCKKEQPDGGNKPGGGGEDKPDVPEEVAVPAIPATGGIATIAITGETNPLGLQWAGTETLFTAFAKTSSNAKVWTAGDVIGNSAITFSETNRENISFSWTASQAKTSANAAPLVFAAAYPATGDTFAGGAYSFVVPAQQKPSAAAPSANAIALAGASQQASIPEALEMTFRNVFAYAKVKVVLPTVMVSDETPVKLTISSENVLAGNVSYDVASDAVAAVGTPVKSIEIDVTDCSLTDGCFVAMVPATHSALSVVLTTSTEDVYRKTFTASYPIGIEEVSVLTFDMSDTKSKAGIYSAADWEAFAAEMNKTTGEKDLSAWAVAGTGDDAGNSVVNIYSDITTTGNLTAITAFPENFILEGGSHDITQSASTSPLVITNNGILRNFTLKGACVALVTVEDGTAQLARINYGTVQDVINEVNISFTHDGSTAMMAAGLVIRNGGTMLRCENKGNITISITSGNQTALAGGVAAFGTGDVDEKAEFTVGTFNTCKNSGNIVITVTTTETNYLQRFGMGGICSAVLNGTKDKFAKFVNCTNTGRIARIDLSTAGPAANKAPAAALGGILGRACNHTGQAWVCDSSHTGYYLEITNCTNSGEIDNGAYITGWNLAATATQCTVSGARASQAGGIAGIVYSYNTDAAVISGCTNNGTIRGGHKVGSVLMGGICGMTSNVNIVNCTVNCEFKNSAVTAESYLNGAMGGVIGYIRHSSTITTPTLTKVDASGLSNAMHGGLVIGIVAGGSLNTVASTVTINENEGVGAKIKNGNNTVEITTSTDWTRANLIGMDVSGAPTVINGSTTGTSN